MDEDEEGGMPEGFACMMALALMAFVMLTILCCAFYNLLK